MRINANTNVIGIIANVLVSFTVTALSSVALPSPHILSHVAAAAVTDVALTIADLPAQYTVKVFLVDSDHAPLRDPLN